MLMILINPFVFMENDTLAVIDRADIPAMASTSALNGDFIFINRENIEVFRIE